jgi:hypothetical protein
MANENYNNSDTKEALHIFTKDMVEAWEDFLINKETVSALLEDARNNETEESYKAILNEVGINKEAADAMITEYEEALLNG